MPNSRHTAVGVANNAGGDRKKMTALIKDIPGITGVPVTTDCDFGRTIPMLPFPIGLKWRIKVAGGQMEITLLERPPVCFSLCSRANFCFPSAMPKILLAAIVTHCDKILRTWKIGDYDGAANGLQVENSGAVSRITAAVDASLATVKLAIAAEADLLIVHHGLFWSSSCPWTGKKYELLRLLIENNLAVYSSHLPLDAHPKLGNNAQLCAALGFRNLKPFFLTHGQTIGFKTRLKISRAELAKKLTRATGTRPRVIPGGGEICKCIGVVTGGAGGDLKQAANEGVDTLITGEGPHWTYALAEDLGVNVFYGGHYATETFGVKVLAAYLSRKFHLPWTFLDHPTGL